jgi:hypothetical protein
MSPEAHGIIAREPALVRMLNVAIAVDAAAGYPPRADAIVSAACEEVIGAHRCPVARDLGPGDVVAWYALVRPGDGGPASVHLEFRDRSAGGVLIEERSLTFSPHDPAETRLSSVGSVIAALVAAREGAPARAAAPVVPPLAVAAPRSLWSGELAALYGVPIDDGPTRWGALGRARLETATRWFARVSARYAGASNVTWWGLGAGGGASVGDAAAVHFEAAAELVFERVDLSADRAGEHASAAESTWGGRVDGAAVWPLGRHVAAVGGVEAAFVRPRIRVVVAGQPEEQIPSPSVGFFAGVRYAP